MATHAKNQARHVENVKKEKKKKSNTKYRKDVSAWTLDGRVATHSCHRTS